METETKTCRHCRLTLPLTEFAPTRNGSLTHTCKKCREAKRQETLRRQRNIIGGGRTSTLPDPDFDGKSLREVMDLMSRAKRWLESRGCIINLSGEYHETKIKKLKFE